MTVSVTKRPYTGLIFSRRWINKLEPAGRLLSVIGHPHVNANVRKNLVAAWGNFSFAPAATAVA